METIKFQVKVKKRDKSYEWVHFCYVPLKVRDAFYKWVNNRGRSTNSWLDRWAAEDFGLPRIDNADDLAVLKQRIRAVYKELYPEIYIESDTDNQGWLRVWTTNKMKKELEKVGKYSHAE